jgi:hypothetical protein
VSRAGAKRKEDKRGMCERDQHTKALAFCVATAATAPTLSFHYFATGSVRSYLKLTLLVLRKSAVHDIRV